MIPLVLSAVLWLSADVQGKPPLEYDWVISLDGKEILRSDQALVRWDTRGRIIFADGFESGDTDRWGAPQIYSIVLTVTGYDGWSDRHEHRLIRQPGED